MKGRVNVSEVIGAEYPVFGKFTGETTSVPVSDAIISGEPYPVKALIVQAANPALTWPDTGKVRQALGQLDLLVVCDLFMTETAKLADIFLPVTSFLEAEVLKDYSFGGLPLIAIGNKVVEPLGDCREDWWVWSELGRRMGYGEYFSWQSTDELLANLLEPSGITVEQLKENSGGIMYHNLNDSKKYMVEGLNSPSGKVEVFSQVLEEYGYDPLPTFTEPELAEGYPFILTTGARVNAFTHSQHRNVARLRKLVPQPLVEINTSTARELGVADGDRVTVESPRGSIKLEAKITDDIHPRVFSLQHGWEEANANILTDDKGNDPISGYPAFKSVMCRVTKAD